MRGGGERERVKVVRRQKGEEGEVGGRRERRAEEGAGGGRRETDKYGDSALWL